MIISMIAAVSQNYIIGANGKLPWRMPNDMQFFVATTRGHTVIMGRKTFEEIGKPLSDRKNIIVSSQATLNIDGAFVVHSLEEALEMARAQGETEAFIIGGERLFLEGLDVADKMYITWIHAFIPGDTYFPRFNHDIWQESARKDYPADAENPYPYSFTTRKPVV
jgi:dihydrofolate reductase